MSPENEKKVPELVIFRQIVRCRVSYRLINTRRLFIGVSCKFVMSDRDYTKKKKPFVCHSRTSLYVPSTPLFWGLLWCLTVWKFGDFSVNQILREINLEEFIWWPLNFDDLLIFNLQKVQKFSKNQNSEPLNNGIRMYILHF